jgi:hypothetical protein
MFLSENCVLPKAKHTGLEFLHLKEGVSTNIYRAVVHGKQQSTQKYFSFEKYLFTKYLLNTHD